jgi:CRISPR system Cascade subunit CasB
MSAADKLKFQVRLRIARLDEDTPWSRAMLAKLRRGIGKEPGDVPDILEITAGSSSDEPARGKGPTSEDWTIHTALTLYALHRQGKDESMHAGGTAKDGKPGDGDSFGRAAGRLIKPDKSNEGAVKRRFDTVVTAQDLAELSRHARGMIQLLRAADIPIKFDYERFAKDLFMYCHLDTRTQVRLQWGRDFYRIFGATEEKEAEGE